MKTHLFFILILTSFCISTTKAGHLIGGEMQYECLGSSVNAAGQPINLYRFTIKLYQDAAASGPNVAQSFDQNL